MKLLISSLLVFLALLERVFFDLGPNVELVTMAMILAAFYLGNKYSIFVVLATLVISDLIIGNSNVAVFTWTGFFIPALVIDKLVNRSSAVGNVFQGTLLGVGTSLFFFFWTNFGVWLLSGMYPNTTQGLMMSYVNGLPFLKLNMLSTLLFVPLGFTIFEFSKSLLHFRKLDLQIEKA